MNAEPVDARAERGKPVEMALTCPPVVALQPVLAQVTEVAEADALRPVGHCLRIRPARPAQPLPQVVEVSFGDLYAKRADLRTHRGNLTSRSGPLHPHSLVLPHSSLSLTAHSSHTGAGGSAPSARALSVSSWMSSAFALV